MRVGCGTAWLGALAALAACAAASTAEAGANVTEARASATDAGASVTEAGASVTEAGACPAGCECAGDSLLWYYCGDYIVKARDDGYIEINCQNNELKCSALPRLDVSRGGAPLQRVELTRCAVPAAERVACAAAAAGAVHGGGARALALQQAPAALAAASVRGLALHTLFMSFMPGALTSFPYEVVSALPLLRRVRVLSGTAVRLPPGGFAHAPPLALLEVSMSGVPALPGGAFRGLANLTFLSLWGNNITDVAPDAFTGVESLEQLILNSNPLGRLPPRVFAPAPHLKRLCLERVRLAGLDRGVFEGLHELEELKVRSDVELRVEAGAFSNLPSLTSLSLTRSGVREVPGDAFHNTTRLVNLTLSGNALAALPGDVFANLSALQRLDLSGNKLEAVSRRMFADLLNLTEINLDGNRLQDLPDRVFGGLTRLVYVSAAHNLLHAVSYYSLAGASALRRLDLSHNRLAWGSASAGDEGDLSSPFHMLDNLKTLDLSHNNISCVFSDWRYVLRLETLNLSWNNFTELTQSDMQYFGNILENKEIVVDFRHNSISSIQPRAPWNSPAPLARLLLSHNPYTCDCHLYSFMEEARLPDQLQYDVSEARCREPPELAGRALRAADLRAVTCAAPAGPACACVVRPARARLECTCTDPADLPDLADTGLADIALRLTAPPASDLRALPPAVRELNLSALELAEAPELPGGVTLVDLTRNRIQAIPRRLLEANLSLLVAGNPLRCDCRAAEAVALLQARRRRVADYGAAACAGGGRVAVAGALCAAPRAALAGGLLALAVVCAAAAAAAARRYRAEALVLLHARGWCARLLPREPADGGKRADVFVSFAPEDEGFVCGELLPRLEGRHSLLVQERDWEAGGTIPAHVRRSVAAARRTLVVVSPRYLRSLWAPEGLRALHSQATADRRPRAVVVLLHVTRDQLDEETRALLALATVLRYGERLFWDKLAYALPRGPPPPPPARGTPRKGEGLHVELNREGKLVNAGFVKDIV